jgi:hypothetical protein
LLPSSLKISLIFVIDFQNEEEYLYQNILVKNYFQNILLPLIVISVLIYQFRLSFYVIEYSIDNKSFTEKYCTNKDKPLLECNGKCHLSKIVKEDSKNKIPITNLLDREIIFNQINEQEICFFSFSEKQKLIFSLEKNFNSSFQLTDYPPPKSYLFFKKKDF